MPARAATDARVGRKRGQAMVETVVVLVFLLFAFFAVFQFADNLRAKLLCEYAAGRCARAGTIGMNEFMVTKTARIATMAAAGECLTRDDAGGSLDTGVLVGRSPSYLECEDEAAAEQELDFDYWRNGRTHARCVRAGAKIVATVTQRRPQFFDLAAWLQDGAASTADADGDGPPEATITGTASIEAHCPDWMQ
ncbi:MAG: TadE/TadG family type IV pilus assembly protein [Kiritimatiellia bacterium]